MLWLFRQMCKIWPIASACQFLCLCVYVCLCYEVDKNSWASDENHCDFYNHIIAVCLKMHITIIFKSKQAKDIVKYVENKYKKRHRLDITYYYSVLNSFFRKDVITKQAKVVQSLILY